MHTCWTVSTTYQLLFVDVSKKEDENAKKEVVTFVYFDVGCVSEGFK